MCAKSIEVLDSFRNDFPKQAYLNPSSFFPTNTDIKEYLFCYQGFRSFGTSAVNCSKAQANEEKSSNRVHCYDFCVSTSFGGCWKGKRSPNHTSCCSHVARQQFDFLFLQQPINGDHEEAGGRLDGDSIQSYLCISYICKFFKEQYKEMTTKQVISFLTRKNSSKYTDYQIVIRH